MTVRSCLILCCMVWLCNSLSLQGVKISDTSTSPTISVQRFRSSTFYNFVKLSTSSTPSDLKTDGTTTSSSGIQGKGDTLVLPNIGEDDAGVSTTLRSTTTSEDSSVVNEEVSSVSSIDDGANNNPEQKPDSAQDTDATAPGTESSGNQNGNPESSAPEDPQKPAEPVPGQPGEDSIDSSSESSSSSSEEFLSKKLLKQKFRNDLISKVGKTKDLFSGEESTEHKKDVQKNKVLKFL